MAKMKVAQVPKAGGDFEIVEREIPSPGHSEARIRLQACGICFSHHYVKVCGRASSFPASQGMKSPV